MGIAVSSERSGRGEESAASGQGSEQPREAVSGRARERRERVRESGVPNQDPDG